jgi:hypothetical protein
MGTCCHWVAGLSTRKSGLISHCCGDDKDRKINIIAKGLSCGRVAAIRALTSAQLVLLLLLLLLLSNYNYNYIYIYFLASGI